MRRNKYVSIWAPLRYANYGDDLQAIAFGLMIKEMGYDVKIFQLEDSLSKQYGLRSVKTIDELCENTNLCIIAGGALLTPFNILKRTLHRPAIEYERDFRDLLNATKRYPIKFCAISMGGDGQLRIPWMYYSQSRINFFKSAHFLNGTVRLQGDVEQMKRFGKDFQYFPDMLFQTPHFFEFEKLQETTKYRIGFNLKKGKYLDRKLVHDIVTFAQNHDDFEFHFLTTHMEKIGLDYQFLPNVTCSNICIDKYQSPRQLLGVLASMDVFVTSMLHLGLTGLTVGTPFVSYRGPGKAKSLLRSIGGDWAIVKDDISFDELRKDIFSFSRSQLYNKYDKKSIERMIVESRCQFDFCRTIVEEYA